MDVDILAAWSSISESVCYDGLKARDPAQAETAMNNFTTTSHDATLSSLIDMEYLQKGCIASNSSVALPIRK